MSLIVRVNAPNQKALAPIKCAFAIMDGFMSRFNSCVNIFFLLEFSADAVVPNAYVGKINKSPRKGLEYNISKMSN